MSAQKPTPAAGEDPKNPQDSAPEQADPKPAPPTAKEYKGFADQGLLEPTRYGDWDVKGRCSDF